MSGKREDRKHSRVELSSHPLKGHLALISGNQVTACLISLKDVSKSGAGVFAKFEVPVKTRVLLSIEGVSFPPLEGRIVWCSPTRGDPSAPLTHPFRLGIDFSPADDAARENQLAVYAYISKVATDSTEE
ncbi:MAG: PilZ domain-containing protein [Bdellovibrionota bacterium]